eukprot:1332347-Prymnesium_polylepis.1
MDYLDALYNSTFSAPGTLSDTLSFLGSGLDSATNATLGAASDVASRTLVMAQQLSFLWRAANFAASL